MAKPYLTTKNQLLSKLLLTVIKKNKLYWIDKADFDEWRANSNLQETKQDRHVTQTVHMSNKRVDQKKAM